MTWQKYFDTPPAPGEIDPVRLLCWFQMAVDSLAVPEDVMQYICDFDAWDVQNLLVYGSNMMPAGWPHDSEIDAAPNNERFAECWIMRPILSAVRSVTPRNGRKNSQLSVLERPAI